MQTQWQLLQFLLEQEPQADDPELELEAGAE
jgi:hypothetical protein